MDSVQRLVLEERTEFADLVNSLDTADWGVQSLCSDWTVRDVITHVLVPDEATIVQYLGWLVMSGLNEKRLSELLVGRSNERDTNDLVNHMRFARTPQRTALMLYKYAPRVLLSETYIHQQDIRRPLGAPRADDPERLCVVGNHLVKVNGGVGARRRARDLRLCASDIDWFAGESGPRVQGPAEAIIMAIAGRHEALAQLEGDGVDVLRSRMTSS